MNATPPGTRERLIAAMGDALQRRGMNGIGLNELLSAAQAPKGVLYHHFPGGKSQLTVAAIDDAVERMLVRLDRLLAASADPLVVLRQWITGAQQRLGDSGYERGCPLATVALESTAADAAIRDALARAFAAVRRRIAVALAAAGHAPADAEGLAALIVAAYEGGLLQARVERSLQPVTLVTETLVRLLARPPSRKERR